MNKSWSEVSLGARTSRPHLSAKRENVLFGGLHDDEMVALSAMRTRRPRSQVCGRLLRRD